MGVLDVRGTHGSGKSWLVHKLLKDNFHYTIERDGETIGYHVPKYKTAVVGKYSRVCGGCDAIKRADDVCDRVRVFSKHYDNVVLEGILVAHTFQRYSDLATELKDYGYTFLFLNTPLQICIGRVVARRHKKGNNKLFNPKNVAHDHKQIWQRVRPRMQKAGHNIRILSYINPWDTFQEELCAS